MFFYTTMWIDKVSSYRNQESVISSDIIGDLQWLDSMINNWIIERNIAEYNKSYNQKIIFNNFHKEESTVRDGYVGIDTDNKKHVDALSRWVLILKETFDKFYEPWMINDYWLDNIIFCSSMWWDTTKWAYTRNLTNDKDIENIYINLWPLVNSLSQELVDSDSIVKQVGKVKETIEHEVQHYLARHQLIWYNNWWSRLVSLKDYADNDHFDYLDGLLENEYIMHAWVQIWYYDLFCIHNASSLNDYTKNSNTKLDLDEREFTRIKSEIKEKLKHSPSLYALTSPEEFMSELHSKNINAYLTICEPYPDKKPVESLSPWQIALIKLEIRTWCKISFENKSQPFERRISFEERKKYPYSNEALAKKQFISTLRKDEELLKRLMPFIDHAEKASHEKLLLECIQEVISSPWYTDIVLSESEWTNSFFLLKKDWVRIKLAYECYNVSWPLSYTNSSRGAMWPMYWNSLYEEKEVRFDDATDFREKMYVHLDRYRSAYEYWWKFTMIWNDLWVEFSNPPLWKIIPTNDVLTEIENNLLKTHGNREDIKLFLQYQIDETRNDIVNWRHFFEKKLSQHYLDELNISWWSPVGSPESIQKVKNKLTSEMIQDYFLSKSEQWWIVINDFIVERDTFISSHSDLLPSGLDEKSKKLIHFRAFLFYKKAELEWTKISYDVSNLWEKISADNSQKINIEDNNFPSNTVWYVLMYPPQSSLLLANPYWEKMLKTLGIETEGTLENTLKSLSSYEVSFLSYWYALAKYSIYLTSFYKSEVDQVYFNPSLSIQEKKQLFEQNGWEKVPELWSDKYRKHYFEDITDKWRLNVFFETFKKTVAALGWDTSSWNNLNQWVLWVSPNWDDILSGSAGFANYFWVSGTEHEITKPYYGTGTIAYRNTENKRSNTMKFDLQSLSGDLYIKIVPYWIDGRDENYPKDDITFLGDNQIYNYTFDWYNNSWSSSQEGSKIEYVWKWLFKIKQEYIKEFGSLRLRVHTNSKTDQRQAHIVSNYKVESNVDVINFKNWENLTAFNSWSADLLSDYEKWLDSNVVPMIKEKLGQNSSLKIFVDWHTDADGGEESNVKLSSSRAKNVKFYIMSQIENLKEENFIIQWYGETNPLYWEESEKRAWNRRVEITIE